MSNEIKILAILGLATLLILVGGAVLFELNKTDPSQTSLVRPDSHQTGPADAKITIVEFADFQCPACAVAADTVLQLKKEYVNQVNFVFRHFPLPNHANARIAAQAAEAAGDQNKFWEMYQILYRQQKNWQSLSDPSSLFNKYAKDLELDSNKFDGVIKNKTYEDKILLDLGDGKSLNVASTPTFFIDGKKYIGSIPYSQFKGIIDQILSQ